jgi:hypothetical protein
MVRIKFLLVCLLGLLFLVNTCSAAVEFNIPQDTVYAYRGETVSFNLNVNLDPQSQVSGDIIETFSIDQDGIPGWGYHFSKNSVTLNNANPSDSSVLYITVPNDAAAGEYEHTILATGDDGVVQEVSMYVVNTNVSVPEFPSVAVPVAAVLGLMLIFGRKKD